MNMIDHFQVQMVMDIDLSYRLDNPSILQGVNHILSDAGQLALKLLTPDHNFQF